MTIWNRLDNNVSQYETAGSGCCLKLLAQVAGRLTHRPRPHPRRQAQQAGETVAETAFTYAAGHPDTETARRYGRSVGWRCGSCDRAVGDHGLCNGPAEDERGHTRNCHRLAATIDARDAEWDAIEADWEAGQ